MLLRHFLATAIILFLPYSIFGQKSLPLSVAVKIGNNGNFRLGSDRVEGENRRVFGFGNGYQAGVEFFRPITGILGLKAELGHLNSNIEVNHTSIQIAMTGISDMRFHEQIYVNLSSFNFSPSLLFNLGPVKLACGLEFNWTLKATGRGERVFEENPNTEARTYMVQYNFYSRRKQVFNTTNPDEKRTYDTKRLIQAINFNVDIKVFKSLSCELKALYPLTPFIKGFQGIENLELRQRSINAQLSFKYTHLLSKNSSKQKRRKP